MDSSFDGWKDDEIIGWSSSETPSKSFSDITIDFDIQRWGRSKFKRIATNRAYLHYHERPILRRGTYLKDTRSGRKSGELRIFYTFVCKTNPNHTYERVGDDGSTKGLQISADKCVGDEGFSKSQQTKLVVSENQLWVNAMDQTDRDTYRHVLAALWCTTSARPFNVTHDHYFQEILKLGNGGSESVPNIDRHRVVEDAKFLQELLVGTFFITLDGWTAPQGFSYVLVYLHFRERGDTKKVALGFIRNRVLDSHTGDNIAALVYGLLDSYEVCETVMAPTCDRSSIRRCFSGEQICKCDALTTYSTWLQKGFLSRFKKPVTKKRVIEGIGTSITADEVALSQLEAELRESGFTEEAELEDQSEEVQAQAAAIDLIREEAAPKATCSPKEELEACFMLTKFLSPPVHLVKTCPTRWNGEDLKDALRNLCGKPSLKLERCRLTRTEWEIMEQANLTLQLFQQATDWMSRANFSNLASVIPLFNNIGVHLSRLYETYEIDGEIHFPDKHAAVQAGAATAQAVLDKYFLKATYLKKLDWEEAWIMEAMDSLQEFQQQHYKAETGNSASTSVPCLRKKAWTLYELDTMIDNADDTSTADYLVEFIKGVPLPIKTLQDDSGTTELDGLKYHYQQWQEVKRAKEHFRVKFHEMAMDIMAVPACFFRGSSDGFLRHQLSDPVFRSAMMLKLWEQDGFMPPMKELFGAVKQNDRKKRKGAEAARKKAVAEAERGEGSMMID
ncbi:hypothetical protein BT69DRAFT_1364296 [Atractiella rhizophila]|nr:hypothetical protein BT69DRAFT_1364296 [Atractiella rhizophila]